MTPTPEWWQRGPVTGVLDRLLDALIAQLESRLDELRTIDPAILGDVRTIGRAQLPSTVLGCIVHAAEHGMRHLGQLVVTVRVVAAQDGHAAVPEGQ